MPSSALRELLKCWLPGGDEEISGNPSPWAPCVLGEARDGCEDAGARPRGGGNMLLSGFRYLHLLSIIWVLVGVFVHATVTNVEIVGQVGLTDVLRMQGVGEHCSLGSCQQHRDSAGGEKMQQLSTSPDYHSVSSESLFSPLWCF